MIQQQFADIYDIEAGKDAIIGYYRSGMAMELMVYYSGKDEAEINKIIDDHLKNKKQPPNNEIKLHLPD